MAQRLTFAFPGDLQTLTGGYLYDRRVIEGLQNGLGWDVTALALDDRFPWVDEACRQDTARLLMNVSAQNMLVIDGLALGAMGHAAAQIQASRPFVALVHHPLALESGLTPDQSRILHDSERFALQYALGVVVTSQTTRQTLIDSYRVSPDAIVAIEPGVQPALVQLPAARFDRPDSDVINLLSVGSIVPRKGYDRLIDALSELTDLRWHLTIVGDKVRSPQTTSDLMARIQSHTLEDRVSLAGTLAPEDLAHQYQGADIFALTSHYEGYGMAYTEAMAWGLPIVATAGGAISSTLGQSGARLIEPDDRDALIAALRQTISSAQERRRMGEQALAYAKQLGGWDSTAKRFADALTQMHTR